MLGKETFEDSLTLDNYFQISKQEAKEFKRQRKEIEQTRKK